MWRKGEVKKWEGKLMDPAEELFSVITSDWKIVCFKEQKPEALLVRGDLKFLINRKQKYHTFHIICSCHTSPHSQMILRRTNLPMTWQRGDGESSKQNKPSAFGSAVGPVQKSSCLTDRLTILNLLKFGCNTHTHTDPCPRSLCTRSCPALVLWLARQN